MNASRGEPLLGCHVSAAGGLHRAYERGDELGCTVIQLFTRNQRQWAVPPLSHDEVTRFREASRSYPAVRLVLAHGSYLVNLATSHEEVAGRSSETLLDELNRCWVLGIPYLIMHPGAHRGQGVHRGIRNTIRRITEALALFRGTTVLLVETTAGQGTGIGYRFEHLRDIITGAGVQRVGVCMDTCHIFSAGYDIRTSVKYRRTLREFDRVVGLDNVKALHLNDSMGALASRIDRHTHIGRGEIGIRAFSLFMNDERLSPVPKIIETPKRSEGIDMDPENLMVLKKLIGVRR